MNARRNPIAAGVVIALTATLAACDGGSSSESASASPSASTERDILDAPRFETPLDETIAASDASIAAVAALDALTYVQLNGGEGVESLPSFLTDEELADGAGTLEALESGSADAQGTATYVATAVMVSDLEDAAGVLPFGAARVTVCVDYSAFTLQGVNDPAPVVWPNDGLFAMEAPVEFDAGDGLWRIADTTTSGLPC